VTQIDFYILADSSAARGELFACKLADKAYHLQHSVYIQACGQPQAKHLDELLWTFNPGSFLPHSLNTPQAIAQESTSQAPITIGHGEQSITQHDVLINLTTEVPPFFSQFERVAEIVYGDESTRNAARNRYKFYRDRGYTLNTHNLGGT
jgi:DNA polymerase-3 subunit chi